MRAGVTHAFRRCPPSRVAAFNPRTPRLLARIGHHAEGHLRAVEQPVFSQHQSGRQHGTSLAFVRDAVRMPLTGAPDEATLVRYPDQPDKTHGAMT